MKCIGVIFYTTISNQVQVVANRIIEFLKTTNQIIRFQIINRKSQLKETWQITEKKFCLILTVQKNIS